MGRKLNAPVAGVNEGSSAFVNAGGYCEQARLDNPPATTHPPFQFIMRKAALRSLILAGGLCLWLPFASLGSDSPTNALPAPAAARLETNAGSDESLRVYLQLQEQIHEALLAIERNRQDSEDTASRNSKALTERLQMIEQSLSAQRASEFESLQHANRTMVILVSSFAALGCLGVFLTAYFQWRAVNRFTAVSSALALGGGSGSWQTMTALERGENAAARLVPGEPWNARLLGAVERLEKRIQELERASRPALNDPDSADNILDLQPADEPPAAAPERPGSAEAPSPASFLAKGQSLLNAAKLEEAIACFDEVLAMDAQNAEALVKKGTALERLRRTQEALECYDRAIAADSSMTIAYLYKGGLYNRMERFTEALACYEQALHTQEKRRAS
jgi:tetratricopeptide (TPR) repeat protein